jgi:hypothetical protein
MLEGDGGSARELPRLNRRAARRMMRSVSKRMPLSHDRRDLAQLLADAEPVIARTLSRRRGLLTEADADDVRGAVRLRLVRKLTTGDEEPIASFADYVAIVTLHAADDLIRAKHPRRTMLANRIRYVVTRDPRFALWEHERELVCGLAAARGSSPAFGEPDVHADPENIAPSLEELLVHGPRPLHAVVSLFAAGVREPAVHELEPIGVAPRVLEELEARELLARLWGEIATLPSRQRAALLLNLRDDSGGSALALFPQTGVASAAEIAAALDMKPEELAALWNDLPLEDDRIGVLYDLRRQQVINLRKAARERLGRRMARW